MSYGTFPDFLEIDHRVIYELPLLSGGNIPGFLHEPNRAHGFIANPSSPTIDNFLKSKAKPAIDIDLIELDSAKNQQNAKLTHREKSKKRDRGKSVRFGRADEPPHHPPPPARRLPSTSINVTA